MRIGDMSYCLEKGQVQETAERSASACNYRGNSLCSLTADFPALPCALADGKYLAGLIFEEQIQMGNRH